MVPCRLSFLVCGRQSFKSLTGKGCQRDWISPYRTFPEALEVVPMGHVELPIRAISMHIETKEGSYCFRVRAFEFTIQLSFELV
jgi:hypothetical protein